MMAESNTSTGEEHVVSPVLDEFGNEPHFPSSKSVENMESIILESSPLDNEEEGDTGDEGESLALEAEESATEALAALDLKEDQHEPSPAEPQIPTSDMQQSAPGEPSPVTDPATADPGTSVAPAKPLAKYFEDSDTGGSGDFFDTLESMGGKVEPAVNAEDMATDAAQTGSEGASEDSVAAPNEEARKSPSKTVTFAEKKSGDDDNDENSTRIRTTSVSEEIQVAFEESKGGTLPATPSTKNLSKFFTEDGASGDADGSSFFDSFTVSEGGEQPGDVPRPSVAHSISQESQPDSLTDCIPPETPPIPGSSPFHSHPPTRLPSGDDVFSASLRSSDEDRRHDAWIPSEATQQVLAQVTAAAPGSHVPEPEHITMPGIIVDEPLGDPVKELVKRCSGEQEAASRTTLTPDSVPHTEDGLRQLIRAECYRAAVDLTTILLTECGQGVKALNTPTKHTSYTLQLWFLRLSLFMKLRLYAHADSECQAFGTLDKPDLYYEYYRDAYPGRRGSMVPFEMRVLHAVLPLYLGKTQESLDRLFYLYAITTKILQNLENGLSEDGSIIELTDDSRAASRKLWEEREMRLLYSKVNCLLNIKDYSTALEVFETLMKKDKSHKTALLCAIARTYLQMGDIEKAEEYFEQAEKRPDSATDDFSKSRLQMNKGFTTLGKGQFTEAHQFFSEAVKTDPTNTVAINNMAVCSLYTGRLAEALKTLEDLVTSDPAKYLQEGILFNLCTLYELESSHANVKKRKLLSLVSQHKGNGFNASCLKLA